MTDLKFAIRRLLKNPGFTAVAVLSLAIGIGINTTIFSALDAAFLRSLDLKNPQEIVRFEWPAFTFGEYEELQSNLQSLSGLVAVSGHGAVLRGNESQMMLKADMVSRNFFTVLGVDAAAGRLFSEQDQMTPTEPVVVISYGLWQRRFGADPKIIGQTLNLVGEPATVVGVAAKGFNGIYRFPPCDLWYPVGPATKGIGRESREFSCLGRLKPGYQAQQVQAEAQTFLKHVTWDLPKNRWGDQVIVWSEAESTMEHGGKLPILAGPLVALVLLVACANVSILLLARYEDQRRELAVRVALGGGRVRLLRQLLIEGLVLSALGAAVALLLTSWAIHIVPAVLPPSMFSLAPELRVDNQVLVLALVLACGATLVFTLLPGWRATRVDLSPLLKGEVMPVTGRGRWLSSRNALVVVQLAVAMVFLATSSLLIRGFIRGTQSHFGFDPRNVLTVMFGPGAHLQSQAQFESYLGRMQEHIRALPGVRSVSLATRVPLGLTGGGLTIKTLPAGSETEPRNVSCTMVEPHFFKTLGIHLLRGRDFTERDDRASTPVMIISESMARQYWPKGDALGKTLRAGFGDLVPREIVGIARDVDNLAIGQKPEPLLYLPLRQESRGDLTLLVRTRGRPTSTAALVRREMKQVDKGVVIMEAATMSRSLRFALLPQWIGAWFGGVLGLLAFFLAMAGLYGVVAYSAARRTRELGIRMALGAQRVDALWLVLRQGFGLAVVGTAMGLPVASGIGMLLRSLLFGVSPMDPVALVGSSLVVVVLALLASYLPARRATRINPMEALRSE